MEKGYFVVKKIGTKQAKQKFIRKYIYKERWYF